MTITIGLLGGTNWPSTISYYETLNRAAEERTKGEHSATILLYSIDYNAIKNPLPEQAHKTYAQLREKIGFFLTKGPDCLILCSNTLHAALDQVRDVLKIQIPVFHAGMLTAEEAEHQGRKNVLLLGTEFTMTDGFYARYFEDRGIQAIIPSAEDRATLQNIQSNVARGNKSAAYTAATKQILERHSQVDAAILASTELPLIIGPEDSPLPLINPVQCQCNAAAEFAFG